MSKKFRNRLLALFCLLVFLGLGGVFYVKWVVQRPFAVILFLADNLTPSVLTPARNYEGGADHRLALESFPYLALARTHANDFAVCDGAAAATSIGTGRKGNNGSLGVVSGNTKLPNLLEIAAQCGRLTGLVSNASLTDATPAAFYASTSDPLDYMTISRQLAENPTIDILLGGGAADFLPTLQGGRRQDGRDLLQEMRERGYDVALTQTELEQTPRWRSPKTLGLFAMGNLAFADEVAAAATQPSLATMVRHAIQLLQYNQRGYLLVVDAALAGKSGTQNEGERTLRELLALDDAVREAKAYAGEDALIIVAGKRNVGGLRLNGYPFRNDKGAGLLGTNAQGVPSITWSTGPESGTRVTPEGPVSTEPAASKRAAAIGTAEDAVVVATGPGSEKIHGFLDNTDLFRIVEKGL
ncbi:MAG: alkaline phosphatase [Verrucomicrobia bacterium]|nr:alkaline phosphatase [Verrucomicrobiota bacterium]